MKPFDNIGKRGAGMARHKRAGLGFLQVVVAGVLVAGLFAGPAFGEAPDKVKTMVEASCVGCHGMDGNSVVPTFPKLAGEHSDQFVRQMNGYISGLRKNDIMASIAAALDPDDFEVLGAYFAQQKPAPGTVLDPKLAEEGKKLYFDGNEQTGVPACEGCHGTEAQGGSHFPRMAGQNREYVIEQMTNFKTKVRGTTRIMREVANRMSEAEIKAVAEYLGGL